MRTRWTQPALDDLKAISYRIEQDRNLDSANRVCRSIYDAIQILRRHPHSGRLGTERSSVPKSGCNRPLTCVECVLSSTY